MRVMSVSPTLSSSFFHWIVLANLTFHSLFFSYSGTFACCFLSSTFLYFFTLPPTLTQDGPSANTCSTTQPNPLHHHPTLTTPAPPANANAGLNEWDILSWVSVRFEKPVTIPEVNAVQALQHSLKGKWQHQHIYQSITFTCRLTCWPVALFFSI